MTQTGWTAGRSARALASLALCASVVTACGSASAAGRPVVLSYYNEPDSSPATQDAANACSAASHGAYRIVYNKLPSAADLQRQQLVRRLAAHDSSIDIMGLDVTWEAEFSEAGWILPWTGSEAQQVEADTLPGPLQTAMWNGKLVAVPQSSNTELLWYRSDLVPNPPATWGQMIADAVQLAKEGKPHYIEIQGAQYEGLTVWFNSLVASAGGSILNANSTAPSMGAPALKAMQIMSQLAHSPAADPSLSVQQEDQNRLAMEGGTAAFEINYPFVYPSMKSDNPALFKNFKWTTYPQVSTSLPLHSTLGGIDLTVSSYSKHAALARQAVLCLRDPANQLEAAVKGGLPPTLTSLYQNPAPEFVAMYPFYKDILQQLTTAAVRPKTPEYQAVSIYISHTLSPPGSISPASNLSSLTGQIRDALDQKGLIP
ncbi:ABC transporter substrate-binding protein [Acidiferrimicrobium sp. IK]|uniref:ABC transporter substrate-binding protein n=1 Tax=Acidiferrimicrobium sp. IK TaxID=2871700 RepID=UPI0021CB7FC4|nr:ABC transporter substrate-binding protein [Acidiferrimicrobium sp. IK]MCU4184369.1 ABC transporter substrate-binding protein [Acidiferrimicrobium sp. IK]